MLHANHRNQFLTIYSMSDKIQGTVKWFDAEKGYGFIKPADNSKDVFVHSSAIPDRKAAFLEAGQEVEYLLYTRPNGLVVAKDVVGL